MTSQNLYQMRRLPLIVDAPPTFEAPDSQLVSASQIYEQPCRDLMIRFYGEVVLDRKLWEYCYIWNALQNYGPNFKGARGLGFGSGQEFLPSVFAAAGIKVLATDYHDRPNAQWEAEMLEGLYAERFVDRATYDRNVSFRAVDMNDIPPDLGHFDFIWSAGSLEHIGGHQNGLDFIVRSMDNLKPSGIAVHTTEFTISSETVSYDTPEISFYSRADITQLAKRLIDDGHFIVLNFRRGDTVLLHQPTGPAKTMQPFGLADRRRERQRPKLFGGFGRYPPDGQGHGRDDRTCAPKEMATLNRLVDHLRPLLLAATVARSHAIGQQARAMFDSLAHDGVKRPGTREMTVMLAGLMALNAFAIDSMIPALADIGRSLHVVHENDQQLVVIAYFLGFASTQLLWGPLADRFGRKPILAAGVVLYGAFALLCAVAGTFPLLIAGRVAMGASAAVTRVLVVAMVRDLFEAEAMARVMSLVFMTFMLVPVLAPNIGQLILLVAPWRAIFVVIAFYAAAMLSWSWLRLPETLHPEYRRSLDWRETLGAIAATVREPQSRGYTLATTVSFAGLVAYISSIQQIIFDAFHEGRFIGLVFASIAAPMALASWLNSRVVGRFGLRRVGHSAALAFMTVTAIHAAVALGGLESLPLFIVLQALTMACFAFTSSNLGTLAMEHMAAIAGTASSVQGVVGTVGAALIGFAIGQQFDGTPVPFIVGTALCAAGGFVLIVLTEPKRLFAPMQADPEEQEAARESTMIPEDLA